MDRRQNPPSTPTSKQIGFHPSPTLVFSKPIVQQYSHFIIQSFILTWLHKFLYQSIAIEYLMQTQRRMQDQSRAITPSVDQG